MQYVYLLRSKSHPKEQYIGCTTDLKQRILDHNQGHSPHTAKFTPWKLVAYFALRERKSSGIREIA